MARSMSSSVTAGPSCRSTPKSRPMGRTGMILTSPPWMTYRTRSPACAERTSRTGLGNVVCPFAVILDSIMGTHPIALFYGLVPYHFENSMEHISIASRNWDMNHPSARWRPAIRTVCNLYRLEGSATTAVPGVVVCPSALTSLRSHSTRFSPAQTYFRVTVPSA